MTVPTSALPAGLSISMAAAQLTARQLMQLQLVEMQMAIHQPWAVRPMHQPERLMEMAEKPE
jgi:hypothetical protein